MSGFVQIKTGSIELEHYSVSSLIKMTVWGEEEITEGRIETVGEVIWFDYKQWRFSILY